MSMLLSILMACTLSHADIPAQVNAGLPAKGECTGSYRDKTKGKVIGAWSMRVQFVAVPGSSPADFRAVRTAGGIVVPELEGNAAAMKELETNTLQFIVEAIKSGVNQEFSLESEEPISY